MIAGEKSNRNDIKLDTDNLCSLELDVSEVGNKSAMGCSCGSKVLRVSDALQLGKLIVEIIKKKIGAHATIKLQIEFDC